MELIRGIEWKEAEIDLEAWRSGEMEVLPLPAGLEAEVCLVTVEDHPYVLKIWNRRSKPDVARQYSVLNHLYRQGAAVSRPYGWGLDPQGHQVLLTSYDGKPVHELDEHVLGELARMLSEVHRIDPRSMSDLALPSHDLVSYFFDGIQQHPDIQELLHALLQQVQVQHTHLIHGDYNLNNILNLDGKLTIIDWTNIQLGDCRYDIAWSVALVCIYAGESFASQYRAAFQQLSPIDDAEYEVFEAIACLRWMLLERFGFLRYDDRIRTNMEAIVRGNRYLHEGLMLQDGKRE